jgi:hypothetical protein
MASMPPAISITTAPFTVLEFAAAARALARAAGPAGLTAPGFRCPPRLASADRSLRRRPDGSAIVAVRLRDRPMAAVVADMIEGVLAANRLSDPEAAGARRALWEAVADVAGHPAEDLIAADVLYRSPVARVA